MNKLMPFLSKILAPIILGFLTWASDVTGIVELTSVETQAAIAGLITWGLAEVTHTLISKKTNPSNAASTQLAVVDKERNEELKANEALSKTI